MNSIHPTANIPNASYDLLMKSTSGETIDPSAAQFDVSVPNPARTERCLSAGEGGPDALPSVPS